MIKYLRNILNFLRKINNYSLKPMLPEDIISEIENSIDELNYNELETFLKKSDNLNLESIETLREFFSKNIEALQKLEWLISQMAETTCKAWLHYIPHDKIAQEKHRKIFSSIPAEILKQSESLEPLYYFKQKEEVIHVYKDIYILIPISDGYMINNTDVGLTFFNKDLSVRKIIHIEGEFIIDREFIYNKFSSDEFIFYYFNFIFTEQYNIWYVNITTGEYKPIRYMGELNEFFPQKTYYWKDDLLFLINFTGQFYVIDHHQGVLTEISEEYVQKNHPDFHNYAIDSLYYDVVRAYPQTYSFIFRDKESKEIGLRNSKDDTTKIMKFFDPEVHDIRLHKEYFLFVQKKQIEIRKNKIKRVVIPAPSHYDFYDALCLEENGKLFILALAGFYKIPRSNSLILYEIVKTVEPRELELYD